MIKFQAKYLRMLYPFMAQGDIRYYLNAMHVEPHTDGGAVLVATNGHIMIIIRDVEAVCTEQQTFKLNRDALRYCMPIRGSTIKPMVYINPITERLTISDIDEKYIQPGKCLSELPPNGYPKYEKVIPKFSDLKPGSVDMVNAEYVATVAQLCINKKGYRGMIRFWQAGKNMPIVVEFPETPEALGIIMPIHDQSNPLVNWIKNFAPRPEVTP